MSSPRPPAPAHRAPPATDPGLVELCLMGPRHLASHLEWFKQFPDSNAALDVAATTQFWRGAAARYGQLALEQAGAADQPQIKPLPAAAAAHVAKLLALPAFRATFNDVPVAFGMVELDRLVVSQYTLTQATVHSVGTAQRPSPGRLAQICLPLAATQASVKLAGHDDDLFSFIADAHDMRYLGAKVLDAAQISGLTMRGHVQKVVALCVGYSTNLMNVVRYNGRLVLNNGHHRAYSLRAQGVSHVPCVIQACASFEEVRLAATDEIVDNSDLYFEAPRPPMLRDFDDPLLSCKMPVPRLRRELRLRVSADSRQLAL